MEKQQWIAKNQQAVAMDLEPTDDYLNNGISNNLVENGNENINAEDAKKIQNKVERNSRIQQVVEAAISEMSRKTIENILDQVKTLTPTEHLLLYLKLPTECSNAGDPLRQPLNPLGSRSEISQTIMWIKTHLEEDPELSLPKQDVYNEYYAFCGPNKIKPLSTADFGKVMKQVYPRVRPRRLGTRGNSRYCYAGLRRRFKLDSPLLPDLSDKPQSSEVLCSSTDLIAAAWAIVKEWSEHQLGTQFPSLQALACYLVLNLSVGSGSGAAALIASVAKNPFKGDPLPSSAVCNNKHRETQLQLQRKIQQKNEINREQKRKIQLQSPKVEQKARTKKCKLQSQSAVNSRNASPTTAAADDTNISPSEGLQPVCDKSIDFTNLQALPDFSSFQKTVTTDQVCEYTNETYKQNNGENENDLVPKPNAVGKVPIPRLNSNFSKFSPVSSPKRAKNAKYKAIQPKPEPCDIGVYNPQPPVNAVDFGSQQTNYTSATNKYEKKQKNKKLVQDSFKTEIDTSLTSLTSDVGSEVFLARERLISVADMDKSALDDYLGTNNSQEHEEELVKYFENKDRTSEQDVSSKLSQLRQLLITQQNMNLNVNTQSDTMETDCSSNSQENALNLSSLLDSSISAFTKTNFKNTPSIPNLNTTSYYQRTYDSSNYNSSSGVNARRRVSFEMLQQEDAVPPSPNTRRKNFNFTPISPGPLSPNGRQSKCSSTTASPFVSPRNTPVPRAKGNLHQNVSTSYVVNQPNTSAGVLNFAPSRKPGIPTKPNLKIKQETDTHSEGDRLINQINESNEVHGQLVVSTEIPSYLPMSAPPSPKLPIKTKNSNLLQKLLNSSNKVTYTPNYSRSQSVSTNVHDSLSTEISQLFSNNISQLNVESGYRSQSVPLHQMSFKSNQNIHSPLVQNSFMTQFPFIGTPSNQPVDHSASVQNDFNDYDSFSGNENINMNKILSTLETCPNEAVMQNSEKTILSDGMKMGCDEIPSQQSNVFTNISDIDVPLNNNLNLAVNRESFDAEPSMNFEQQNLNLNIRHSSTNILPSLRGLGRSQSIDVDMSSDLHCPMKYNPSRSVPGTPVPCSNSKTNITKNYRSYPSTPLTMNETFSFNHGQDYLLNGQPIKEKLAADAEINQNLPFFQNSESNDEIYNNVDMFNVNDTNLNCDILIGDNKNNFNFESQLCDTSYGAKHNISSVLDESCIVNGNEFDFKNSVNSNGS